MQVGFKRFRRNVDKKYFLKSKNPEKNKIMILGIHYFITKLKTKIDVIPRGCFKLNYVGAADKPACKQDMLGVEASVTRLKIEH